MLVVPNGPKTDRTTMLVVPNGPKTDRIMFKVAPPNQTTVPRATVVEAYRDTDADSRHLRDMRAKTHHNIQLILKQTDFLTRIDNNYSINSTCVAIQSCNAGFFISENAPSNHHSDRAKNVTTQLGEILSGLFDLSPAENTKISGRRY